MKDRTATSVLFGFAFQANAAIVIMLDNIKDMDTIRLEGSEDIEIKLNDGRYILAQAKAVVNSSTDFSNVRRNLKDSLVSLSEAEQRSDHVNQSIYITNSPNPFNEKQLNPIFYGMAQRDFKLLPQYLKDIVNNITSKITNPLVLSKFKIQILPFETDNLKERHKCVMEEIRNFVSRLGIPISSDELHRIWADDIFKSGTIRNQDIKLTKNDIIWPIIVIATNDYNMDDEDLDSSEIEEISRLYKDIINTFSEKYEFVTKILYAYNDFQKEKKSKERKQNFIKTKYQDYSYLFDGENITMSDDIKMNLLQIIIRNILNKRIQIDNIKKAVNL